jgi:phosphatidylinositol alpha 1,6-mannosyltransferase
MRAEPRIAFFTDSYLEVNGVAHTSRQLAAYAQRRGYDFLCVHAGPQTEKIVDGSLTRLALARTSIGFKLDADLRFDALLWRHAKLVQTALREFAPEVVHITGPSDIGLLGIYIAHKLRLPIVMSWHTNLHEYAGQRLLSLLPFLSDERRVSLAGSIEALSLKLTLRFYKLGKFLLAPNEELGQMLQQHCGKPWLLMWRGVNTELFSPVKRKRHDGVFRLGYVGRLTPEKNVRLLAAIENQLLTAGYTDFRFVIVGTGSEREWLEQHMRQAEFTGVLKGEDLARAYANLDLFIFPSHTDTFGNVVLEAQAAGVPALVTAHGGPKFIIRDGVTGIVARDEFEFAEAARQLINDAERLQEMRAAARALACAASWDSIFEHVYEAYRASLMTTRASAPAVAPARSSTVRTDAVS